MMPKKERHGVTRDQLMDAIGDIQAVYVEEAENYRRSFSRFRTAFRVLPAAACLLLTALAVFALPRYADPKGTDHNSLGTQECLPEETTAGGAGSDQWGAAGGADSDQEGAADGADSDQGGVIRIPKEAAQVMVFYERGGTKEEYLAEGEDLLALRQWADGLLLGEALSLPEETPPSSLFEESVGENPDSPETGTVYLFRFTGEESAQEEFSYRNYGSCYIVTQDTWYPVKNPSDPPLPN